MLFNSIDFAIFMPIVFAIYWLLGGYRRLQNVFLLTASYFFYAWWDWRYLSLILFCTAVNYSAGYLLSNIEKQNIRKYILLVCCVLCLGVLGVFKYYNFFVDTFVDTFSLFGVQFHRHTLNLILPVGISFYTFHTLSYTIDVYRRLFEPTKDVVSFSIFVSIFPLAMAGPIERASNLLPQIYKERRFDYSLAVDGLRQILWGLFKKVVIADNCAVYVNDVFANPESFGGSSLLLGAILFAIQIYGDFSGYSDMAIGIGKLLGFKFIDNFNYPYFSRDIAEFWRRWHMSLTTWFRDYLYIPLGGSRTSKAKIVRNTFIIFLVSGFWHGANWTFIAWGIYHAILFLPLILMGLNRKHTDIVAQRRNFVNIKELLQMLTTFLLVTIGWILFRADSIRDAFVYLKILFSKSLLSMPDLYSKKYYIPLFISICILFVFEWKNRDKKYGLDLNSSKSRILNWFIYIILVFCVILQATNAKTFIYFQF